MSKKCDFANDERATSSSGGGLDVNVKDREISWGVGGLKKGEKVHGGDEVEKEEAP